MIEARELRLQNWVQVKNVAGYCRITGLDKINNDILPIVANEWEEFKVVESMLDPIPLSVDVLIACGLIKNGFNEYEISISPFEGQYKMLTFSGDYLFLREGQLEKNRMEDSVCVIWNKDLRKQFYLHEFQNLIYLLTGEELTVNL